MTLLKPEPDADLPPAGPLEQTIEASPEVLLEFPQVAQYDPVEAQPLRWKVDLVDGSEGIRLKRFACFISVSRLSHFLLPLALLYLRSG